MSNFEERERPRSIKARDEIIDRVVLSAEIIFQDREISRVNELARIRVSAACYDLERCYNFLVEPPDSEQKSCTTASGINAYCVSKLFHLRRHNSHLVDDARIETNLINFLSIKTKYICNMLLSINLTVNYVD